MGKKQDRWPKLCKLVEQSDGLPVRQAGVGPWTEDKLYFWNRYIDITTSSMVQHPKWPEGLVYVDLFAGPGVCEIDHPIRRRFPGSTLIAAHAPKPFRSILLCELDRDCAVALDARMARSPAKDHYRVFCGDCNDLIAEIAAAIPLRALTLAFVDPEGLHIKFETIRVLAERRRVDLLILFADRMDIVRNVDTYFVQQNSNLDRMLGDGSNWRQQWEKLANGSPENICRLFANIYQRQLRTHFGYKVFREKQMNSAKGPLYRLIFASKDERGAQFWDKITRRDRGGQDNLF